LELFEFSGCQFNWRFDFNSLEDMRECSFLYLAIFLLLKIFSYAILLTKRKSLDTYVWKVLFVFYIYDITVNKTCCVKYTQEADGKQIKQKTGIQWKEGTKMEKLRIAICDDIKKFREMIIKVIRESELYGDAEIQEYEDGEDIVNDYEAGKFDVIFMDYYMERMKGNKAAELIHDIDRKVSIIIASSENSIAVSAYSTLTHISKPFGNDVFEQVMKEHQQKQDKYKGKYVEVLVEGRKRIIISEKIEYIDKKNGKLYMRDGNTKLPEPLPDFGLEESFQLVNGNIISLKHIARVEWKKLRLMYVPVDIPLSFKDWFRLEKDYRRYF